MHLVQLWHGPCIKSMKQKQRKVFDADPSQSKELEKCKGQIHNYERSLEMSKTLEKSRIE